LFFGILLFDAMLNQNQLFQDELQRNYANISAYIQNGIANQADLDVVKIEQLKAKQSHVQIKNNRKKYIEMLSAFIGEKIDVDSRFIKPDMQKDFSLAIQRPELALFDIQNKVLDAAKKEINAGLMPKLGLFVTGSYGKPGLNMLNNKFAVYYIGGLCLTWNLGNFYTRKTNLQIIENKGDIIQVQRESFLFNTSLDALNKENEIDKYFELLQSDDEIIALRTSVKQSAENKYAGGTLSASDLLREINAEQMAKQDKIIREIELLQTVYGLKHIINDNK
jgi:outer membrane protein TolC